MESAAVGLIVTQAHLDAARSAGACKDGLKPLKLGQPVGEVPQDLLMWFLENCSAEAAQLTTPHGLPLWALSNSGYGDGHGHGYGSGSGYGSGFGFGFGHSYGSGSGDGSGLGFGDGFGSEYGSGSGDGRGN